MMRRLPTWFQPKSQLKFQKTWPWAFGGLCGILYFYNPQPFDELAGAALTKVRKPVLKGMEWMDIHDVDTETLALELPPDQLFGPLAFPQQMKFLLQSLKADNELADGYLARLCLDNFDLSLDPLTKTPFEKEMLENGGKDLLDFAVEDFTERRVPRKHKFFHPDAFLRLVNWLALYPTLSSRFVNEHDGVNLILTALRHAKEDYSRVLAMRCLCIFSLQQEVDGSVEKTILRHGALKTIVDCYRQSTGDPTDTRFLTLLLSSMTRHYPEAAAHELTRCGGFQVAVDNLNISRYKGVPQHLRVLNDLRKLPPVRPASEVLLEQQQEKDTGKKVEAPTNPKRISVDEELYNADAIPVMLGVMEVFPEYYESIKIMMPMLRDISKFSKPFEMLEYRSFIIFSKLLARYSDDAQFNADGVKTVMAEMVEKMLNDPTCKRALDPSVMGFELEAALKLMNSLVESEKAHLHHA
jgi:hypothetical protein